MESNLRRYRTGFVELVSPVTHVWYLKSRPSKIALILNIPLKELEKVVYFNSSSIGLISNRLPSSGEIPSCRTIMMAAGTVTFGFTSIGIEARDIIPANKNNNISDNVALDLLTIALRALIILKLGS